MDLGKTLAVLGSCVAVIALLLPVSSAFSLKRTTREIGGDGLVGLHECSEGGICAFQTYDADTQANIDFFPTCRCPTHTQCVPAYDNLLTAVINLRCKIDNVNLY